MKKSLIALFALAGISTGATCVTSIDELDQSKIASYFNFDTGNTKSSGSESTTWYERCLWNEEGYATATNTGGSYCMYSTSLGMSAIDGFTVSFDVNSFSSGTILSVLSNGASNASAAWRTIRLTTDEDGSLNLHWCAQSFDTGITSDMLDWTTLTIVCETNTATVVSLYVDGVFNNSISIDNPANFKSEGVTKAQMGWFGTSSNSATSTIDNVLFYKEALSATEVAALIVPEPATASLSLLGLAALMIRRRR